MKTIKKFTLMFFAIVVSCCLLTVSSLAGSSDTASKSKSSDFQNEWEKTRTYTSNGKTIGYMTFGYDTDFFKEDYVWTKGSGYKTTASIKREAYDVDFLSASQAKSGKYSKKEVRHVTFYVTYQIDFSSTFNDLDYTTKTSTYKG